MRVEGETSTIVLAMTPEGRASAEYRKSPLSLWLKMETTVRNPSQTTDWAHGANTSFVWSLPVKSWHQQVFALTHPHHTSSSVALRTWALLRKTTQQACWIESTRGCVSFSCAVSYLSACRTYLHGCCGLAGVKDANFPIFAHCGQELSVWTPSHAKDLSVSHKRKRIKATHEPTSCT